MNAEHALFRSIRGRLPPDYSFERFLDALIGWKITPLTIAGELIGAVMTRRNEIHVGCERPLAASGRAYVRAVLKPLIDQHGWAVTSVMHDNAKGLRFCKRLGFVVTSSVDGLYRLRCERANYV